MHLQTQKSIFLSLTNLIMQLIYFTEIGKPHLNLQKQKY